MLHLMHCSSNKLNDMKIADKMICLDVFFITLQEHFVYGLRALQIELEQQ